MRKLGKILSILGLFATILITGMSIVLYTIINDPSQAENVSWGFLIPTLIVCTLITIISHTLMFTIGTNKIMWKTMDELQDEMDKYGYLNYKLEQQKEKLTDLILENTKE